MSDSLWGKEPESEQSSGVKGTETGPAAGREWRLIEKLVSEISNERRRARRWGIFFKLLTFAYLTAVLVLFLPAELPEVAQEQQPHVGLVELEGTITADSDASADVLVAGLREAFKAENSRAVLLRINSPGGSPVQAGQVYDEIRRLRAQYPDKPLYAVIQDIGASGAYYIAAAADEIYADKASLVGSIGVISSGFGFVGLMEKLGIERRAVTAGEHKAFLDPFSPADPVEQAFWKEVLDTTHRQFIEQVRKGRGDRLKERPELFSGLIWSGEQALDLGLVDGLASAGQVARDKTGLEKIVNYSKKETLAERLAERLGAAFARQLATELGLSFSPLR